MRIELDRKVLLQRLNNLFAMCKATDVFFTNEKTVLFDGMVGVVSPFVIPDVSGSIRTRELVSVLNKLSSDKVSLCAENGILVISSGKSKSGIRIDTKSEIPIEHDSECFVGISSDLVPALCLAEFCASHNTYGMLSGILVSGENVTSTDNHRLIRVSPIKGNTLPEFLFPASAVGCLKAHNPTHVSIDDNWIMFKNADVDVLLCRILSLSEGFPDVEPLLDVEGTSVSFPEELLSALERAEVFLKAGLSERDKSVELSVKRGRIALHVEGLYGWHEESVRAAYEGDPFSFFAHPRFLQQILPHTREAVVGDRTVLFAGENFRHVFVKSIDTEGA